MGMTLIGLTEEQVTTYLNDLRYYSFYKGECAAAQVRLTLAQQHLKTLQAYLSEAVQAAEDGLIGTPFPIERLIEKLERKLAAAETVRREYAEQLEKYPYTLGRWTGRLADLLLQLKADGCLIDEKLLHELLELKKKR